MENDRATTPDVWLIRHGETEWTVSRRHTGSSSPPELERTLGPFGPRFAKVVAGSGWSWMNLRTGETCRASALMPAASLLMSSRPMRMKSSHTILELYAKRAESQCDTLSVRSDAVFSGGKIGILVPIVTDANIAASFRSSVVRNAWINLPYSRAPGGRPPSRGCTQCADSRPRRWRSRFGRWPAACAHRVV